MVRRCSRVACRSRDLRRSKCDRGVALEPVLPVGHDAFTPGKTGGDDRQVVVGLSGLDRARLGDVLAADGPDEETIGSALDRGRGNDDGVAASFEQHPQDTVRPNIAGQAKERAVCCIRRLFQM
jgi:hypothetical protein